MANAETPFDPYDTDNLPKLSDIPAAFKKPSTPLEQLEFDLKDAAEIVQKLKERTPDMERIDLADTGHQHLARVLEHVVDDIKKLQHPLFMLA